MSHSVTNATGISIRIFYSLKEVVKYIEENSVDTDADHIDQWFLTWGDRNLWGYELICRKQNVCNEID